MKITEIRFYVVTLPYVDQKKGYTSGRGTIFGHDAVIVEMICDNGLTGWGEHTPIGSTYVDSNRATTLAALEFMGAALIGHDPCAVSLIQTHLDQTLKGHLHAKSAFDIACWDLWGKSLDVPVYQLLGGRHMASAPMYSIVHALPDPEAARRMFLDLRRKGYTRFQIKAGDQPFSAAERVNAICSEADFYAEKIFVDGNTKWNRHDTLFFLRQVKGFQFVLEQPCLRYEDCLEIRRMTDRPMKLDENLSEKGGLLRALTDNAMEIACLKISYFGGISGARLARDMCIAHGVLCQIEDTWGSEIVTSACAHLAVNTPEAWFYCTTDLHNLSSLRIAAPGTGPVVENGRLAPRDLPGLGITPDRTTLGAPVAMIS